MESVRIGRQTDSTIGRCDMAGIKFVDAKVPEVKRARVAEPNPFVDACAQLNRNRDKALSFTLQDKDPEALIKAVEKAGRQLNACGRDGGYTVRRKVDGLGTDKRVVTFWVVDKIVHKPHAPRQAA